MALQKLPLLQEEVQSLKAESTGLKEELSETRALVTSLHAALSSLEIKLSTVSATVELLQSDSSSTPLAESTVEDTHSDSRQTHKASNTDATQQKSGGRHGCRNCGGRAGHRQQGQQRNQNIRIASNKNKAARLVPVYLCLLHQHLCQMLRRTVHSLTQLVPKRFRHKVLGVSWAH